jgi:hypothetical protein
VGSHCSTKEIVGALWEDFREPIHVWQPGCRLVLPSIGTTGTLILQGVGSMTMDDQRRLFDWLEEAAGRVRVVSTTGQPLLPRVKTGMFPEALYYRLNILCFEVTEPNR